MTLVLSAQITASHRQVGVCSHTQQGQRASRPAGPAAGRQVPATFIASSPLLRSVFPSQHGRRGGRRGASIRAAGDLEAYVWGAPSGDKPWACPFCHSLLLAINEKTLSYDRKYVDYKNKPDWFAKENPEGKMPLLKDQTTGKFIGGLDTIINYLEDKFVEPSIGQLSKDKSASTVPETDIAGLWEAYKAYAHTQEQDADNDADDTRAPLENRLSALADALKENGGQFFGKDYADATDLVLGPRLNHILVVLKHLNKDWALPSGSEVLGSYLQTIRDLPSWKTTAYDDSDVIDYYEQVVKPAGGK